MMEILHHYHIPGCFLAFISYFFNWKIRETKYIELTEDNQIQKNITDEQRKKKYEILSQW